jgi:hypothetical protein
VAGGGGIGGQVQQAGGGLVLVVAGATLGESGLHQSLGEGTALLGWAHG